jgi:hypothetical protein
MQARDAIICRMLRALDEFREEDHPRGQPDNAGKFAEKPASRKAKSSTRSNKAESIAKQQLDPA